MSEIFPTPVPYIEAVESTSYQEFLQAQSEEDLLVEQWKDLFANTPDRAEAEKVFLEKLAPRIQSAKEKTSRTLKDWLDSVDDALE